MGNPLAAKAFLICDSGYTAFVRANDVMWHRPAVRKVTVLAAVFATGLAVGLALGARVGLWEFMLADAQYKAPLLASDIKAIKAGDRERVITSMEISLDAELAKHGEHMESRLWWLWPELTSSDE